MTPAAALAALLGLAVGIAIVRLALRHFRTAAERRDRPWRMAILLVLQPLAVGLLYLTFAPPPSAVRRGTLVVATRHAPATAALVTGDRVVALPEAPAVPGAERAPDLATALRRSGAARLRVVGDGLTARDRDAATGRTIDFAPAPPPAGLVRLDPPGPVATGGAFRVGGRVAGVNAATVELIDPAGGRVDRATPDAAGNFVVTGTARAAGPASFTLRVRGGSRLIEQAEVPVWTAAAPPLRVLLLAGAPGPEVKYLRRWASDAGLAVHSEIATGAGLDLGDAPLPLTAATLRPFDVAILDDRRWLALPPGGRAALRDAVHDGLGLMIRLSGPVSGPTRAAVQSLGFIVGGGGATVPVVLPAASDTTTRGGSGVPVPAPDPALARWAVTVAAPAATALLRDVRGAPVAVWRAAGRGRIGLWPLADSYQLVLAGRSDRYGALWSSALAVLGRGRPAATAIVDGDARVGQRVALCGLAGNADVVAPNGQPTHLLVDPAAGPPRCAAFWPSVAGWHRLAADGAVPFFVAAADALPGVRATTDRDATLQLATTPAAAMRDDGSAPRPGRSWPWFLAWLATSAALWWFERTRFGRAAAVT